MVFERPKIHLALAVALVAAVGLSGCGRKGGLDLPPSDTAPPPAPTASTAPTTFIDPTTPIGTAQQAPPPAPAPVATASQPGLTQPAAKSFLLDFLLK